MDTSVMIFDDWEQALKARVPRFDIRHIGKPSSNTGTGFGKPIKCLL